MRIAIALSLALTLVVGCNNTETTNDTGTPGVDSGSMEDGGATETDTGVAIDVGGGTDDVGAGTDSGTEADTGAAMTDAGGTGCDGVLLTVHNVLVWCSVSVDGGAASAAATQTVCVDAESDVSLVATALTGFELGDWHHTNGDAGSGDPGVVTGGMSTATLSTDATGGTACVWICCPFVGGSGCPSTDPCAG